MNIEFSQIPAKFNYPRHIKGKLSTLHSDVISFVSKVYDGSHELRSKTIRLLNTITRYIVEGDAFPANWSSNSNPFENIEIEDELTLKDQLETLYINPKAINWDISIVAENAGITSKKEQQPAAPIVPKDAVVNRTVPSSTNSNIKLIKETDKSDLYIQPPVVPQFDINKPWMSTVIDGTVYCIYTSIPEIPTKQNEISATTNVHLMTDAQLLNLYPNNFIRTRSPVMYEAIPGFHYHHQLGVVLPIEGYTQEQLIDNIIKYPHLFKLSKIKDGEVISFYSTIEIDGELKKISEIWKVLPDTVKIPYNTDFVKEYVVRRYLLERDVKGIEHKYPMFGELNPFLTLFSTMSDYIHWGYKDVTGIARQCVNSRVAYKRSRNPVIRRVEGNV